MPTAAHLPPSRLRSGLTLMELVVVLTILVAVAGILVNLFPNLLTKTHDAVTTTNIVELNKTMEGYLNTNLKYPDGFDSIISTSGGTGQIYSKAVFGPNGPFGSATYGGNPVFTTLSLAAGHVQSLASGGITKLYNMQDPPSADGATYGAYILQTTGTAGTTSVPVSTPIATGMTVMRVSPSQYAYMQQVAHIQPPASDTDGTGLSSGVYDYVVFGLGQYCTLIGARGFGIFEAPVSFGEHDYEQPQKAYARMLCIFRVFADGTRCEFLGSAHPDPTGFGTAAMHTEEFYQTQ